MIDRQALLSDLQKQVKLLEASLRERLEEVPALVEALEAEHAIEKREGRTGDPYTTWLDLRLDQVASSWVLATVFARFLEDNKLVSPPRLSGPGDALARARDEEIVFFRENPELSHRELLEDVFHRLAELPALDRLLSEGHNPLWLLPPTADGAKALLEFWRKLDPDSGKLIHDFTDSEWDTRFLGDLYQDLSQLARKRYALLQTPEFVESFILDRTLEPALEVFGLEQTRLIDPACGSGHFLLGAFERLFVRWIQHKPGTNPQALAQRALDGVAGVDLNPFAIAIARFRLLLAALRACGITQLSQAPGFTLQLAVGDSLLHGPPPSDQHALNLYLDGMSPLGHLTPVEDPEVLRRLLGRNYQVVVANPPYITPKDKALNKAYRKLFGACHMKYSLAVPFKERCFSLAASSDQDAPARAGFVGLITANSFMKREFGKKLIEEFLPRWDLTHVTDTSGAYIPGHGTPTVILLGRSRTPTAPTIRAVRGIRGEPSTPSDPAHGQVWSAIVDQIDRPGSESDFVSVDDVERAVFHKHPWSLGGGGAAELKARLEAGCDETLSDRISSIGFMAITAEDDFFVVPSRLAKREALPHRPFVVGDCVRDWAIATDDAVIYPYVQDDNGVRGAPLPISPRLDQLLWRHRTGLKARKMFGKTAEEHGKLWYEFLQFIGERVTARRLIAFAFVATHNHFVLDRGGRVFKQTAPVIKLGSDASEDDHIALLGQLNSSVACFWMKQTFFNRGDSTDQHGARTTGEAEFDSYEHDGTKLATLPLSRESPLDLSSRLDDTASRLSKLTLSSPIDLASREQEIRRLQFHMIAVQEELDWRGYGIQGLLEEELCAPSLDSLPEVRPGERAFEIALARRQAAGEVKTKWFARHGSTPTTEIPNHWPEDYRALVERRLNAMEENKSIRLIERPEYKRRWNTESFQKRLERSCRDWLLDRLEEPALWPEPFALQSAAQLADRLHRNTEFNQVAALYRGHEGVDLVALISELCLAEAVPPQKALRYKQSGLRKRAAWAETWRLQRLEDAVDARTALPKDHPERLSPEQSAEEKRRRIGPIPTPPKYKSSDFRQSVYWRQRGKLDVPKERFSHFSGAERDQDPTPVFGWAGWDHLQQAQAIAAYYLERKDQDGWPPKRLTPLLVALHELLPWLDQWHNDFDPTYGTGLGDYFRSFVEEEARALELTPDNLASWEPPKELLKKKRSKKRKTKKKSTGKQRTSKKGS